MSRHALSAVFIACLLLWASPLVHAGTFHQESVDAARSGYVADAGPRHDEVAFQVYLPGSPIGQVLLDGRAAIIVTQNIADHGLIEDAVWRIDLDSASVEQVVDLQPQRQTHCMPLDPFIAGPDAGQCHYSEVVTDGQYLYIARDGGVDKFTFTGESIASWDHPSPYGPERTTSSCGRGLAIEDDALYVVCTASMGGEVAGESCCPNPPQSAPEGVVLIARLATGDLSQSWLRMKEGASVADALAQAGVGSLECDPVPGCAADHAIHFGLAVVGQTVVVLTFEPGTEGEYSTFYWGFDKGSGQHLWIQESPTEVRTRGLDTPGVDIYATRPTGTQETLYIRIGSEMRAVNPARPEAVFWREQVGAQDAVDRSYLPTGSALVHDRLFVQSLQTLYEIDTSDGTVLQQLALTDPATEFFAGHTLLVTHDTLYSISLGGDADSPAVWATQPWAPDRTRFVYAWDRGTGETLMRHQLDYLQPPFGDGLLRYAVGGATLVTAASDGLVRVLGRTDASIEPVTSVSTHYPASGQEVRVDLSASTAGMFGPPTRFKADWGDGTTTEWTETPVLTHTYNSTRQHTARFWAANDAGQTSVVTEPFDVDGTPPPEPNLIAMMLARENRGITLGILLATVTLLGVLQHRRRGHLALVAEERQAAYREILEAEVRQGTPWSQLYEKTRPVRTALGISDRQHARIEAAVRALHGIQGGPVPGETFLGRYEVLEHLGSGGGGSAFRCRDTKIGRLVVLKALTGPTEARAPASVLAEAQAFGAVDHPNVVKVHDVEQVGHEVYVVLEYVPGGTLAARMAKGRLDDDARDRLAHDLLSGLAAVHAAGLVHRDVKPANILLTKGGGFKLADLGIAGAEKSGRQQGDGRDETVAAPGGGPGTVPYMSPEQARREPLDRRSDLYSAAVVLWEAMTRKRYMEVAPGETATTLRTRIATAEDLPRLRPGMGKPLDKWFTKALAPEPARRFPDAESMRAAWPGP